MKTRTPSRLSSERGATLVHVAIALVSLMGLAAFAVDRGIVWVSRGQAQNAADAGALAGAVARAWDDTADPPVLGIAQASALSLANLNTVWGEVGSANVSWTCPTGVTGRCVRVDVYRNGEFGSNTLPVAFAHALGISSQGVRATATAAVRFGNTALCMRPFSVPDKWMESYLPEEEYNHWIIGGPDAGQELMPNPDTYTDPGAGWNADPDDPNNDIGRYFILTTGTNPSSNGTSIQSGWHFPVRLPDGEGGYFSGGDDYRDSIAGCTAGPVTIGQTLPVENGTMVGPTGQGVADLVALDPTATFNTSTKKVENSCAPGACGSISPRIVPISVFNVDEFQHNQALNDWSSCPGGGKCVRVVNILGFFVVGMVGGDVAGYLIMYPGELISGSEAPDGAQWLVKIQLVR